LPVLRDDRFSCPAHGHRARRPGRPDSDGLATTFWPRVLHAGRAERALLALRRPGMDLPLSAALPDRPAPVRDEMKEPHPRVSTGTYIAVFVVLLCLTGLTAAAAEVDLGRLNTPVAVGIAATKALLVVIYFMHLRYATQLTRVVAIFGVV